MAWTSLHSPVNLKSLPPHTAQSDAYISDGLAGVAHGRHREGHPPAHGATGPEEAKNRLSRRRKSRVLWPPLTAVHFHVSVILETWKFLRI
jgi:hypothetical protein